jgi:ATP-dependent Clp protease ATP-binding subunit ClpA
VVPKINVYLPDDLAEAVKDVGVPVSAICQRALEAAVRRITAIRQAALDQVNLDDPAGRMSHFTTRARAAVGLALAAARQDGAPAVRTGHLLSGVLAEGGNLAIEVLRAMEIEPEAVRQAVAREAAARDAAENAAADAAGTVAGAAGEGAPLRFSSEAANALELAVTEAIGLGHNYVGCEHLLLGVVAEENGAAGQALRALGAEYRPTRRAISAALVGFTFKAQKEAQARAGGDQAAASPAALMLLAEAVRREMQPFVERLERLEQRLGPDSADPA